MYLDSMTFELLERNSVLAADKTAFVDGELRITWSETQFLVKNLAALIQDNYPKKSDQDVLDGIIVDGDGSILHIALIYAILLTKKVYIPANRTLDRNLTSAYSTLPKFFVDRSSLSYKRGQLNLEDLLSPYKKLLGKVSAAAVPGCLYFTSGTTGDPKAIVNSNSNVYRGAQFVVDALGLNSKDVIAGTLLLDFDYGVNQIISNLWLASTYVVCPFSSKAFSWIDQLTQNKASIVPVMPFLIESYFPKKETRKFDFVRLVTSSGAPFTKNHAEIIENLFPKCEIVPMYGMSEGFRATILPPGEYRKKPDSVGLGIGDTVIKIFKDDFAECEFGEVGEIYQSSGCTSWGYLGEIDKNSKKFYQDRLFPNLTWIKSGDLGYLDEEGYLYIKGRVEFQIKRYGLRMSIDEIESAYKTIPGVVNAVVVPYNVNDTESHFKIGVVTTLSDVELKQAIQKLPIEYRTNDFKFIPKVLENYNGGKPDRELNKRAYFED
jgi:acyl-CoA synthetase (AMP-forming)/AMP-acid ligase II